MPADIIPESELRIRRQPRAIREETRRVDDCVVFLEDAIRKLKAGERLDEEGPRDGWIDANGRWRPLPPQTYERGEALPCDTEQEEWR